MAEIFVLAEHRQGVIRDVTFEMLGEGKKVAEALGADLTAVLLGSGVQDFAEKLKDWANKVIFVDDPKLENFNAEAYQKVLSSLISERKPVLTMIGNTSFGLDLAPALAVELKMPIATDCIGIEVDGGKVKVIRNIYSGKINARMSFRDDATQYMVTVRASAFPAPESAPGLGGAVESVASPLTEEIDYKKFIAYEEAAVGEVDITAADILVSVGRGIGDVENIPLAEELAKVLGGVVACSRPVVDKKWLPKPRQVGTSGKTVKPKLYLALGISGAFQHLAGMQASDLIVAVNKDPKAPIFSVANYGIVGDIMKVMPVLKDKITELKG